MIVKCPDCNTKNEAQSNDKKQCRKCLQYLIVKEGSVKECIPKELF